MALTSKGQPTTPGAHLGRLPLPSTDYSTPKVLDNALRVMQAMIVLRGERLVGLDLRIILLLTDDRAGAVGHRQQFPRLASYGLPSLYMSSTLKASCIPELLFVLKGNSWKLARVYLGLNLDEQEIEDVLGCTPQDAGP